MNILTAWRQALVTLIATDLQGGTFTAESGERDGPVRDRHLACVFAKPQLPPDRNVNFWRPVMIVRAWVPRARQPRPETPLDPEPVEQLAVDLLELLAPVRASLVDGLYFEIADTELDYTDWGVQVTLAAWIPNPGSGL